MLEVLKRLLLQVVDDIDSGNSNVTEEENIQLINFLKDYTRKDSPLSKYQAYTYLGISRATFDNLVKEGKLPKGKKQAGFKELFWFKKDLDLFIKQKVDGKDY